MPLEPQDTAIVETSGPARSSAAAETRPARTDVDSLLWQLAQQKEATTRALQSTMAIEKQLGETREELNRALMIAAIPPDPPPKTESGPDGEPAPEAAAHRAHQELEDERKARIDERVTAAAQIARLEENVAHAREKEQNARHSLKRARMRGIAVTASLLLAAVFATRLAGRYPATSIARALTALSSPDAAPESPRSAPESPSAAAGSQASGENVAPQAELEGAEARMHRALAAFPDSKLEDLVEALRRGRVKVDPSSCLLAWNGGQPELLVQDRRGDGVRIAETLTECASAIEHAHSGTIFNSQARR